MRRRVYHDRQGQYLLYEGRKFRPEREVPARKWVKMDLGQCGPGFIKAEGIVWTLEEDE